MTVTIVLKHPDGRLISNFVAEDYQSIAQLAQNNGVEFPVSCKMGACWVCKCKIISGAEHIQIDKITSPMKALERDAAGNFKEFFACIGGVSSQAIKDKEHHEIIIEKNM